MMSGIAAISMSITYLQFRTEVCFHAGSVLLMLVSFLAVRF